MRTRLIFVRHGESIHSVEGFVGGPRACRGLTPRGHGQAEDLAARLADELRGPVTVYSSTLPRARQTAEKVAKALKTSVIEDCGLCTWHYPEYADGLPMEEYLMMHSLDGGGVFRPFQPENETWADLMTRTGKAIMDIAHRHQGETAVLVGHTETVRGGFGALGALSLYSQFDLKPAPASITEWGTDGDPTAWPPARWTLYRFGA